MDFTVLKQVLQDKGYSVSIHGSAAEAAAYIDGQIDGKSVGFGGSVTLEQMGLYELLATHNDCHWHQRMPEGKTVPEVRLAANAAQIYISSVNALAETGRSSTLTAFATASAPFFTGMSGYISSLAATRSRRTHKRRFGVRAT